MSKVNVFDPAWIDIVFEGRNQHYGAYQLRREDGKTTMTALFAGILCIGALVAIPAALSSFTAAAPAAVPLDPGVIVVDMNLDPPAVTKPEPEKPAAAQAAQKSTAPQVKFKPLAVVPATQPTPAIPDQQTLAQANPSDHTQGGGEGNAIAIGGNGSATGSSKDGTGSTPDTTTSGTGISTTLELDMQPEFPGGIEKFRKYIAGNFDPLSGSDRSLSSIRLFVYFIIEKDGTISNIRTRSTDEALSREAVRVLQSLKTKWKPGRKGGEPVRTAYNLPITINIRG